MSYSSVDSIQAALSDSSQGRLPGSVTKVEEAGNMVCFFWLNWYLVQMRSALSSGRPGATY